MIVRGILLFIGIVVAAAAGLLGHPYLLFAVEALLKLAAVA
jgi:hypothetical protein